MRETTVIGQFERRLVELGCPAAQLRGKVRELEDHLEDLTHDAKEEGLSEAEAAARAGQLLGEPVALAERVAVVLRQSSWWGRHPVIGFCLLPVLALPLMVLLGVALDYLIGTRYFTSEEISILAELRPGLLLVPVVINTTYYVALALTAVLFCWLAGRSASGWKWAVAACIACAIHGYFIFITVFPHQVSFGYRVSTGWQPQDWVSPAIPLAVAAAIWARQKWLESRLAPLPVIPGNRNRPDLPRTAWLTPSSVIAATLVLAVVALVGLVWSAVLNQQAGVVELETKIWPAERAMVIEQLQARQISNLAGRATTINLGSRVNAGLNQAMDGARGGEDNNLAGLPSGIHAFAGVPFDVAGRLQLMGRKFADTGVRFPIRAREIPIAARCDRIHLLHGAAFLGAEMRGTNLARLVLHYADGAQAQIAIVAGEHVLDWWGPVYRTGANPGERFTTSPGTELAWVGRNPAIKRSAPDMSLRIYQSSFDNPRPGVEIVSLDYVSTLTDAAPFLLGLTVE